MDLHSSISIFVVLFHISNLMAFLAFLLRDQLQLRLLMGLSLFLQGLYYYAIPGGPLFDPLLWKVVSFLANVAMIALVFGGRLDFGIPEDLRPLFTRMAVLTPGQFRKLTARTVRVSGGGAAILTEGMKPDRLYYLLKGEAQIIKNRQTASLQAGAFLGEIAFLSDLPASATVVLNEGAGVCCLEPGSPPATDEERCGHRHCHARLLQSRPGLQGGPQHPHCACTGSPKRASFGSH